MRETNDCEEAALATAAGVSYEQAKAAIGKTPFLPESVNNPLFGNPENMHDAIVRLGYKPIRRTLTDFINGVGNFRKTVILLRLSTMQQHWVCGYTFGEQFVYMHWGNGEVRHVTRERFAELFGPTDVSQLSFNAAFEIGPREPVRWYQRWLNSFKNLFRKR